MDNGFREVRLDEQDSQDAAAAICTMATCDRGRSVSQAVPICRLVLAATPPAHEGPNLAWLITAALSRRRRLHGRALLSSATGDIRVEHSGPRLEAYGSIETTEKGSIAILGLRLPIPTPPLILPFPVASMPHKASNRWPLCSRGSRWTGGRPSPLRALCPPPSLAIAKTFTRRDGRRAPPRGLVFGHLSQGAPQAPSVAIQFTKDCTTIEDFCIGCSN